VIPALIAPVIAAATLQQPALVPDRLELVRATDAKPVAALRLEVLLDAVRARNPDLIALDEERAAAIDRAIAAGSFPHPSLGFGVSNLPVDSLSFDQDMMTMKEVMIGQRFPWFGKRELRRDLVEQNAALAEAARRSQQLALEEAAIGAYANLWLATASVAVVEEQKEALARFAQIARARYAAGGGSQSDLLRADVELARMEDPLLELEEMEIAARATLASLANASFDAVQGAPEMPPLPPLPDDPGALLARIASHPEVAALEEQAKRSEIEARLEARNRWPDPTVQLVYGQRNDAPDMVGAQVMFDIPVFAGSKEDRLAAAARTEAKALRNRREAVVRRMEGEARAAFSAARRQERLIRLFEEEIVPRAERNLTAAIGAYQAGTVDFLTLLDARVQLQSQRLEALRARASYLRAVARLSRTTGVSLFATSTGAASEVENG